MADGTPIDLDKYRSIGSLRPGYKKSTRKYQPEGARNDRRDLSDREAGSKSHQTEHFDGRLDATIRPKAIAVKVSQNRE